MKWILTFLCACISLQAYEVLTYGDALIDYIVFTEKEKIEGPIGGSAPVDLSTFKTLTQNYHKKCTGGSAVNTTKGMAFQGNSCAVIGRIGNDEDAIQYRQTLLNWGITPLFHECDFSTGRIACLVTPDGQRTMRSYIGPLLQSPSMDIDPEIFTGIKLFHIEGYQIPNVSFLKNLISHAKKAGALISMDAGCFELVEAFREDLLSLLENDLDIFFCNKDEAKAITGAFGEQACKILSEKCPLVIVTAGSTGGFVGSNSAVFSYPALSTTCIDETGAGDLFMAGFLHKYLKGESLESCAKNGAKLAAQIVGVEGAELPSNSIIALQKSHIGNDHEVGIDFVAEDVSNCIECSSCR